MQGVRVISTDPKKSGLAPDPAAGLTKALTHLLGVRNLRNPYLVVLEEPLTRPQQVRLNALVRAFLRTPITVAVGAD
jgi:hypothetical protein